MTTANKSTPSLETLRLMFTLQDSMQNVVSPDWKSQGWDFMRAVMIEGAEAVEHHGWKWWKKQTLDHKQLALEQVDIIHFVMSRGLCNAGSVDKAASDFNDAMLIFRGAPTAYCVRFDDHEYSLREEDTPLLSLLDLQIGLAASKRFSLPLFQTICDRIDLDWDSLAFQYICKNCLNLFRQNHGYKTGEYVKVWMGREDNEWLSDFMTANRDAFSQDTCLMFASHLDTYLEDTYKHVLDNVSATAEQNAIGDE